MFYVSMYYIYVYIYTYIYIYISYIYTYLYIVLDILQDLLFCLSLPVIIVSFEFIKVSIHTGVDREI